MELRLANAVRRFLTTRFYRGPGIKNWMHQWVVPPALWEVGRIFVRRDFFKYALLQAPRQPTPFSEIIFSRPGIHIWGPVEKIVNFAGQAFTEEQHHLVRYLKSGLDDLESFYRIHQPTTALQSRFVRQTLHDHAGAYLLDVPWKLALTENDTLVGAPVLYGPVSDLELATETERTDRIKHSIEKFGFLDHANQPGGQISGQLFLHDNGDYRIVIQGGNHRTAVLAHLG